MRCTTADLVRTVSELFEPPTVTELAACVSAQRVSDIAPMVRALIEEGSLMYTPMSDGRRVLTVPAAGWERYLR